MFMISSVTSHYDTAGFISIAAYCKILNENEILSFVNNFILGVYQKIFLSKDEHLIDLGVSVYGNLVSQGGRHVCDIGINIAPHIEEAVSNCINNLGHKDRGYASLMMLVELLKHAQFITFNKIRKYKYLDLFKKIMEEKNQKTKKKGLELIDECIREISKRDKNQQSSMLTGIFNEFFRENQPKNESLSVERDSDYHYGITFVIKSLLTHANKEVFEVSELTRMLEYIQTLIPSKSVPLQIILLETYPPLSAYNHDLFHSTGGLELSVTHCLETLADPSASPDQQKTSYTSLPRILEAFPPSRIQSTASQVLSCLIARTLDQSPLSASPDAHLVACLHAVCEKIQRVLFDLCSLPQLRQLVSRLLVHGMSEEALAFLEFLAKVASDDVRDEVEGKVLLAISWVLTEQFYGFAQGVRGVVTGGAATTAVGVAVGMLGASSGAPGLAGASAVTAPGAPNEGELDEEAAKALDIETFKADISAQLGGLQGGEKGERSAQLVCSALKCLSRFKFTAFQGQIVIFYIINRLHLSKNMG